MPTSEAVARLAAEMQRFVEASGGMGRTDTVHDVTLTEQQINAVHFAAGFLRNAIPALPSSFRALVEPYLVALTDLSAQLPDGPDAG